MDPKLVQDYSQLLAVERTKLNDMMVKEFARASSTLSGRGMLHSSAGMRMIVELATGRIPVFAPFYRWFSTKCLQPGDNWSISLARSHLPIGFVGQSRA